MKIPSFLFLLLILPSLLKADSFQGGIYSIDNAATTITLSSKKGLKTYRVRPSTEISINGAKGSFGELNVGMTAKVGSADPLVATTVIAVGVPSKLVGDDPEAAGEAKNELTQKLSNTRWRLADGKFFTLLPGGSAASSWHKLHGSWKVIAGNTIQVDINFKKGPPEKAAVNPEVSVIRWVGKDQTAHRINE